MTRLKDELVMIRNEMREDEAAQVRGRGGRQREEEGPMRRRRLTEGGGLGG